MPGCRLSLATWHIFRGFPKVLELRTGVSFGWRECRSSNNAPGLLRSAYPAARSKRTPRVLLLGTARNLSLGSLWFQTLIKVRGPV